MTDIGVINGKPYLSGYVYCIMDFNNSICKIGMSANEKKRVASIRSAYPHKTEFKIIKVQDRCEAERYMHKRFHNRRVHGEWFKGVSFDEYEEALNEYILKKNNAHFDSIDFTKFLCNTEYHEIKGLSSTEERNLKIKQVPIFIYTHKYFADKHLLRAKIDFIFQNMFGNTVLQVICPDSCNNKFIADYSFYSRSKLEMNIKTFFASYDAIKMTNTASIMDSCLKAIDQSYGAIFFLKETVSFTTNKMIEYAKSRGIKVKVIRSDKSTNLDGSLSKVSYNKKHYKKYTNYR